MPSTSLRCSRVFNKGGGKGEGRKGREGGREEGGRRRKGGNGVPCLLDRSVGFALPI